MLKIFGRFTCLMLALFVLLGCLRPVFKEGSRTSGTFEFVDDNHIIPEAELHPCEKDRTLCAPKEITKLLPIKTIARGVFSKADEPMQLLARNHREWLEALRYLDENNRKIRIDFKKYIAIALFLGTKPHGGHGVFIEKVVEHPEHVEIWVGHKKPGAHVAQVVTSPFFVGVIPRTKKPIFFLTEEE